MVINKKKNRLFRIRTIFILLLFAVCLTMNGFFFCTYNYYELLDKTTVFETWEISKCSSANGDDDDTAYFKTSFLNKNHSYDATITKNICSIFFTALISKEISLFLFPVIVFYFLALFILLPNGWTLINQKVRLDN